MDQRVSAFEDEQDRVISRSSRRRGRLRRMPLRLVLFAAATLAVLAVGIWYGRYYWTTGRYLVSTDDAYLQADNVIISPRVSGYISDVAVGDNQPVRAGQVLARIDDRDYRTAVTVAQANVAAQAARIDNLTQQLAQQQLTIAEAHATVDGDRAAVTFARQDYDRYLRLSKNGAGTIQSADKATADIQQKQAMLAHDTAAAGSAEKQVDILKSEATEARALLAQRQGVLRQADLNEGYTAIEAPVDGTVGARTLRVGQYVQAGTQLMAVVPLQAVYVTANYKESQLTDVRAGQPVTIVVDTFPNAAVRGVVDSLAPASGQEFALLPPDNATGNFTKIVQRVPVKIRIDAGEALIGRLRPGMSVEPTIDTRGR